MGNKIEGRQIRIEDLAQNMNTLLILLEGNEISAKWTRYFLQQQPTDKTFKNISINIQHQLEKTEKSMKKAIKII